MEIGDNAIAALNALPGGGDSLAVVLAIGSAVVGVLSAGISGGASVTVPLAILGGGMSVGAQISSEAHIGGGTPESVLESMQDAISRFKIDMLNAEIILVNALRHDSELLQEAEGQAARRQINYLVPWRPNVTDVLTGTDVDFELPGG